MKSIVMVFLVVTLLTLFGCFNEDQNSVATVSGEYGFSSYVDSKGKIRRPDNFREDWTHLGSWYVTNEGMSEGATLHDVYATPESVASFKEKGEWPDGSVLVKAVSNTTTQQLTTGMAQSAKDINVWFVMVRDRHNRFPNNKAWGEGWGWALFTSEDPNKNLTTDWKGTGFNNCFGCHAPVKNTEWVYIDGYPTVRDSQRYKQK
jgi:cytochrome P460